MSLQVIKSQDIDLKFKACIYGDPGTGKTTWTANNVPKPVWIDFERSTDTLKAMGIDDIPIIQIKELKKIQDLLLFVRNIEKEPYETIVLDTISTGQVFQLMTFMEDKFDANNDKRLLPLFQDFRISTQIFNEIFFILQHADINVVLLAHEREFREVVDGVKGKVVAVGPSITPALQESTQQLVNAVLRFQAKASGVGQNRTIERSMLCHTKGVYRAKNRYGVQDMEVINPTWETFMKGNK